MHRRHLLATALVAAAGGPLAGRVHAQRQGDGSAPAWALRAFAAPGMAAGDELATLNARVWACGNDVAATAAFATMAGWLLPPEPPPGEFSVVDTRVVTPVPALDVPARLVAWTVVAGAAAVETSFALLAMHRGRFVWGLAAQSGHGDAPFHGLGDILTDLGIRLSSREIEGDDVTTDSDGLFRGGLWDLLPDLDDLPPGTVLAEQRVGSGGIDPPTPPAAG